jgi:ribosomal protein S27AE
MPETDKMKCPDCGAEMNHHADKLVYEEASEDTGRWETDGGRILEAHTCPACGRSATRAAAGE